MYFFENYNDYNGYNYLIELLAKTQNVKDIITLEKIYLFLDDKEKLFKLLFKQENEYRLMANIENLKDKYNDKLLKYLKNRFYEVVAIEKK